MSIREKVASYSRFLECGAKNAICWKVFCHQLNYKWSKSITSSEVSTIQLARAVVGSVAVSGIWHLRATRLHSSAFYSLNALNKKIIGVFTYFYDGAKIYFKKL